MIAIWITLFVVTIISVMSEIFSERGIYLVNNDVQIQESRPNRVLFLVIILVLILVSGLRSSIGDTGYYMYSYKFTTIDLSKIFTYRDWGYYFFQFALRKISTHPQFILVVTSSITLTLMLKTLYKYTRPLSLGIFLFISSGIYVATMNGLRQYMVAAIIFAATGLIIQNKKWRYFILVLLLSTIHNSVLIMIPVYFIVRQKAWSKKLIILIIVSFIIFIGFDNIFGIFSNLLRSTQYGNYLDTFGEANIGANIIRVFVAAVPVILDMFLKTY
jgi:transmembrane protein EpsG